MSNNGILHETVKSLSYSAECIRKLHSIACEKNDGLLEMLLLPLVGKTVEIRDTMLRISDALDNSGGN